MTALLPQLRAALDACKLRGKHVLLAVSGGADSVALLRGCAEISRNDSAQRLGVEPFEMTLSVAHLNHRLRPEADDDEQWLRSLTETLQLPLYVDRVEVQPIAEQRHRGIEETARAIRYDFLRRTAGNVGCSQVAVAHTADDQAETILHHILRGTGLSGLRGMPRSRPFGDPEDRLQLVRPLLEISRRTVEEFLLEIGQEFREDVSNTDPRFTRNRLRHSLIPLLQDEYNPQVGESLRRLGQQASEIQSALETVAERLLNDVIGEPDLLQSGSHCCRLKCAPLQAQPRALIRECLVQLWKRLDWPRQRMGFSEWDRLADVILEGGAISLPHRINARRSRGLLIVERVSTVSPHD